jgi:hypothetical protein
MFISDGQIANLPVGQVLLALHQMAIWRYFTYWAASVAGLNGA